MCNVGGLQTDGCRLHPGHWSEAAHRWWHLNSQWAEEISSSNPPCRSPTSSKCPRATADQSPLPPCIPSALCSMDTGETTNPFSPTGRRPLPCTPCTGWLGSPCLLRSARRSAHMGTSVAPLAHQHHKGHGNGVGGPKIPQPAKGGSTPDPIG